ncbi:alkaline phosphatase D family protein [Halomonas sp. McH1-25]|uniref:alkaline phosphatase D family protein n=1 Tax=unclassified Halomonas TaxID=2609666 RepID=UPI001EF3EDF6|nr:MULTISPECIES: alkaline phosphatase D family protein [unclassified Halomonas]MCG7600971.1 alkaline phosphatase D family protein [Halomonas sp. McH1-25]MCP1342063.1 alkaline phosphatase D family protein [Halomonas sp. FL8]MCP1359755.1 alkaline phosphatase D family protein [Halomonas sp. BBD45]
MSLSRRRFLSQSLYAGATLGTIGLFGAPAIVVAETRRPALTHGVMSGDVLPGRAMLWSRSDRPARMMLELADNPEFRNARRLVGPTAMPVNDYTTKLDVTGLGDLEALHYRVRYAALGDEQALSEPVVGQLRLPPSQSRNVRFVWSGDTVGQGWGINPDLGGMRIYETMRQVKPDFFIHSGDTIYADGPLEERVALEDEATWKNIVTPAKAKVAETLDEYRGQYSYNLLDENLRRFNAEVPMFAQWDDHETVNNWYPGEILDDPRYTEKNVSLLNARARHAFMEYMPVRQTPDAPERMYRRFTYGPDLEIFRLDMRSYRGGNSTNRQSVSDDSTAILGDAQLQWLLDGLRRSQATWKIVAADMPLGLVVKDGERYEAVANADPGRPLGREQEIARLLEALHQANVQNVVWLTADVHYTAAHHYSPERASFQNFTPFWEFVSGPLNAGTFGPGELDATFGPEAVFTKAPPPGQANLPPSAGYQFFGQVDLDAESRELTVTLKDTAGLALFEKRLTPA